MVVSWGNNSKIGVKEKGVSQVAFMSHQPICLLSPLTEFLIIQAYWIFIPGLLVLSMVINTFMGEGAQKGYNIRLPPVLRKVTKILINVLPHQLPALTMTATPIPEKSLEAQERRGLGPSLITRVLCQEGRGSELERNVTMERKLRVMHLEDSRRTTSQGTQVASRSRKRQAAAFSPRVSRRNVPLPTP